jgi:glycosyltransferase involved in cell wall biosynthesis
MSGAKHRTPRVSIGIPLFNREKYIGAAIDAHRNQSFADFELIITDNASTDRGPEICRAYAASDPRIKYFPNPTNLGAAGNYRRSYELATGEYFRWNPSDDFISPNFLERAIQVLDTDPSVFVAYGRTKLVDADGNVTGDFEERLHLMQDSVVERWIALSQNLRLGNLPYGLIRRSLLRKTGLLRNYIAGDFPLIAEMSLYGKFYELPDAFFYRRMHAEASYALKDKKDLMAYFDPQKRARLFLYNWVHLGANLKSVARSPIPFAQKLRILAYEGKRVIWSRKDFLHELLDAARIIGQKLIHP